MPLDGANSNENRYLTNSTLCHQLYQKSCAVLLPKGQAWINKKLF